MRCSAWRLMTWDVRPPSHLLDGIVFLGHAGARAWMERAAETWRELEVVSAQLLGTVVSTS